MKILKYALQLIVTLLAAFHGFLLNISPPEEIRQSSSIGFASFILLILFLLIALLARRKTPSPRYRKWICVVALVCAVLGTSAFFVYQAKTYRLTFLFPPGSQDAELYVKGEVLTEEVIEWLAHNPGKADSELVDSFGGVKYKDRVWTHESIGKAEIVLVGWHVIVVVSLMSAVLCLLEGLLTTDARGKNDNAVSKEIASHLDQRNDGPKVRLREGIKVDPNITMTLISSGLSLVDKFVDVVRKLRSGDERPHRVEAKQEASTLVIRRDGQVLEKVEASQLHLNEWDSARYDALYQRVSSFWTQFNALYGQLPNLSVDEQVRIKQRMETMRKELCKDFREMVAISEKVLGVPLSDHYTLYSTCNDALT